MRKAPIWLGIAALLAGLGCKGEDNNINPDIGASDMTTDQGTPNNGNDGGGGSDAGADGGDMPLPDGLTIPGMTGTVDVSFDAQGVLHVSCEASEDCFAVQGYFHAAHRFAQMDIQRRFATGRLSALVGSLEGAVLDVDRATRALLSTREGEPLEEAIWAETGPAAKQAITAYTRGVNAWLADLEAGRNDAVLPGEYLQPIIDAEEAVAPWTETDTVACGVLLLEDLSNTSGADLDRGVNYPKLTAKQAFDLLGTMSATQVATMPASGESYDRVQALLRWPNAAEMQPALDRLKLHANALSDARSKLTALDAVFGSEGLTGSNNWVIGGGMTASGNPVLANDPHLGLGNPALWYLVEINASGGTDPLHVTGVSLPGVPSVVLGHNEDIAWGATVVYMDLADVYVEELTPTGDAVVFNGGTTDIIEVEHTFRIARADSVTDTLRFVPHHGPMLSYDPANNTGVSIRWSANDARKTFDIFFGLATATNIDEARTALANSSSTNQNWIVADRNGDIGWFPFNALPQRPWASLALPPWLPLPGDGSAEWGPMVPIDELPQMINPANGFIATANTDPLGTSFDGDPTNEPYGYVYSYGEFGGFRQDAIVRRITDAGATHSAETSRDMQADTFIVLRDWIRPHVQTVIDNNPNVLSPEAETYWATIETWNGECPTGIDGRDPTGPKTADQTAAAASIGCSAFHYLVRELAKAALDDELSPTSIVYDSAQAYRTLVVLLNEPSRLQGGSVYWDNTTTDGPPETQDMIVLDALEAATTGIRAIMGTDSDDWRWGRVHTLYQNAAVFSLYTSVYDKGPYSAPGGLHAINVADPRNPSANNWGFSNGPSMRHVSEFEADGISSYWTLPGGQRHHRSSDNYDNLLDDWLAVNHFKMPFTPADVAAAAVETLVVTPR